MLNQEWLISSQEKVFERCYKKFSERIWWVRKSIEKQDNIWKDIKNKQNKEKAEEHKMIYCN